MLKLPNELSLALAPGSPQWIIACSSVELRKAVLPLGLGTPVLITWDLRHNLVRIGAFGQTTGYAHLLTWISPKASDSVRDPAA